MSKPHVVILGAGFGGMSCARQIRSDLAAERCAITLVDRHNFLVFTPMLTEVAGGSVDVDDAIVPVRRMARDVTFLEGDVVHVDAANRRVTVEVTDANKDVQSTRTLEADHLVIAVGSETNYHHIEGLSENSLTIKQVSDAALIKTKVVQLLESAESEGIAGRQPDVTLVVGGGGFSGVETMAAINDLIRGSMPLYPHVTLSDFRRILVQPAGRLLPEVSEGLAEYARRELEKRGVRVILNTKITASSANSVRVDPPIDGQVDMRNNLLIWAGGITPPDIIDKAGVPTGKHGGIVVDQCCRVQGSTDIWALGDCAEIPQNGSGRTYSPTAQNAMREGPLVGKNIVAAIQGQQARPFHYKPIGELALVGRQTGVASVYGVHVSGLPAWAMWRAVYLAKLPTVTNRVRVAARWLIDLAFGRDVVGGVSRGNS